MKLWLYKKLHEFDDYSVRATKYNDVRGNIHMYSTPWLFKALYKYVVFNVKYPECTIVFTHHRYNI